MLEQLNEQQRAAVEAVEGPVMVFAGAGSGKTKTLTYRIAHMIEQHRIAPYNILAITFTNKAKNEMANRIYDLIGPYGSDVNIFTFHALCARILRYESHHLGYSKNFEIIDDDDQLRIIKNVMIDMGLDLTEYKPKLVKNSINHHKSFGTSKFGDYPTIHEQYEKYMKENNLLDFEDLLIKTEELFLDFNEVLNKYQDRYRYVLVDEFQDTNNIQYRLLSLLTKKSHNLFVVGDDDQSIYSFRGAEVTNMEVITKDYPEIKTFVLEENYRSPQSILDCSNRLIRNNTKRQKKELFSSNKGSSDDVEAYQAVNEFDETEYVVNNIDNYLRKKVPPTSIAVLYRNGSLSRNVELSLIRNKIQYQIYGGFSYLKRTEVRDVASYLRLIVDNDNINAFTRIVNLPARGIGKATIKKIIDYRNTYKVSLFDAINIIKGSLKTSQKTNLTQFIETIKNLSDMLDQNEKTLCEIYDRLLLVTNYPSIYDDEEDKEDRLANIREFRSILVKVDESGEVATRREKLLSAFDESILADSTFQSNRESKEGVILSTIHSAKGLEFDYVFLIGLEEGIFPVRVESDSDMEEERRVAYVAMTRAKKKLYLTYAYSRMIYGMVQRNVKSRFLEEAIETKTIKPAPKKTPITAYENNTTYQVGDKIIHTVYGEGIIVTIEGVFGSVCFLESGSIKKMFLNHESISKKK